MLKYELAHMPRDAFYCTSRNACIARSDMSVQHLACLQACKHILDKKHRQHKHKCTEREVREEI